MRGLRAKISYDELGAHKKRKMAYPRVLWRYSEFIFVPAWGFRDKRNLYFSKEFFNEIGIYLK